VPRASTTTDVFNALGDASRRELLDRLGHGEATVTELVDRLGWDQPKVSKHLAVLRTVDLVRCRRDGRTQRYRIHREALQPLQHWLERLTATIDEHYDRLDDYLVEMQTTAVRTTTSSRPDENEDH
jgi:DNA-binding transcriptional ArsR family regulator